MEPFKPRNKHGPEYHIQNKWVNFLKMKGWHVERMVMGYLMSGIPDLLIGHPDHGMRFVDIKVYGKYSLTKGQRHTWPIWEKYGMGIWIVGATSAEECTKAHMIKEYEILMKPPNWREFWNPKWDKEFDIDKLLEDVDNAS